MPEADILHKDFKATPYWWEAYKPVTGDLVDVPRKARVAIVGGGYAGLSCAIELADAGIDACVLEAAELGAGASTRSGGGVSGGVNIGKSFTGKVLAARSRACVKIILASRPRCLQPDRDADRAREASTATGRRPAASSAPGRPRTTTTRSSRVATLNANAGSGAYMVPQRAPARGDGVRLLLRRHGGGALGQAASGALLQGPARRGAPPRRSRSAPRRR